MIPTRVFVLNGHPGQTSLCRMLAERYAGAARHDVCMAHVHDLDLDMDYGLGGYENRKPLEECLETEVLQNLE